MQRRDVVLFAIAGLSVVVSLAAIAVAASALTKATTAEAESKDAVAQTSSSTTDGTLSLTNELLHRYCFAEFSYTPVANKLYYNSFAIGYFIVDLASNQFCAEFTFFHEGCNLTNVSIHGPRDFRNPFVLNTTFSLMNGTYTYSGEFRNCVNSTPAVLSEILKSPVLYTAEISFVGLESPCDRYRVNDGSITDNQLVTILKSKC